MREMNVLLRSKPMTEATPTEEILWIGPSAVRRDPEINRFYEERRARKMVPGFNPQRARVAGYVVSERSDGSLVWIDGQHRGEAAIMADRGDVPVPMTVLRGLSKEEEAEWVLLFNDGRKATKLPDKHRLGVTANREADLVLRDVAARHNVVVDGHGRDGHLGAIKAARDIVDRDGGALLDETFGTLIAAYGNTNEALAAPLLSGVALFWRTYGDLGIDRPALYKKMAKYKGGALGLGGEAKHRSSTQGGPQYRSVAQILVDQYNVGRRAHRLPPL